jgi:hypothetical protein
VADIFANHQPEIDSMVDHEKRMQSDDVLAVLAKDLQEQAGFQVESGKKAAGKLNRPVFFGDEGEFMLGLLSLRTAVAKPPFS